MTRRAALVAAVLVTGCAAAPLEGAPRVESRRFTVTSDVDPGALALALPVLDAVDEELTRRWGFEDRGRRELLLFADEETWDAFEAAEKPDGERWHGSGFGPGSGAGGAIALEVPPRSRGDDLSQVSFEQVRRLDDAIEVVSRVTRELFLCRLREHLGPKGFKARDEGLVVGAGEVERTAAMARLDGGLEAPYEPGRSEVERALGALAHALELLLSASGAAPKSPLERERRLGSALLWSIERLRVEVAGTPDGRPLTNGEALREAFTDAAVRAAVRRLAEVVLRHPSGRYVRAAGPTLRIVAALRGRPEPEGADPERWRGAAAALDAELAAEDRETWTPALFGAGRRPVPPADLDALLLELGLKEGARAKWAEALRGPG